MVSHTTDFKSVAFDHSATSPCSAYGADHPFVRVLTDSLRSAPCLRFASQDGLSHSKMPMADRARIENLRGFVEDDVGRFENEFHPRRSPGRWGWGRGLLPSCSAELHRVVGPCFQPSSRDQTKDRLVHGSWICESIREVELGVTAHLAQFPSSLELCKLEAILLSIMSPHRLDDVQHPVFFVGFIRHALLHRFSSTPGVLLGAGGGEECLLLL